jgi:DNA-binding CsgD family transcriptional regulator
VASAAEARARVRNDIVRTLRRQQDLPQLARSVTGAMARALPFDGWCLLTLDPATLLPTGEIVEHGLSPAATLRLTEIELGEPDFNKFTTLARGPQPAASLSAATAGALDRSLRQRELRRPSGFDDELRIALSDDIGTWGALTLLRETRRPRFSDADVRFVASMAGVVADGLRRAALLGDDPGALDRRDVGFVVLDPADGIELRNAAADGWLEELDPAAVAAGLLPLAVAAVAHAARHVGDEPAARASEIAGTGARTRTRTGRWVVVRGARLGEGPDARIGVVLEPAQPPALAPLIADAYGLTDRERRVTELVARGYATREIAAELHLSGYTVQDHLKAIFDKTGTSSRGSLVARLYFEHHAPRLG